ncbi:MAG: hypothetical protein Ct9H300mP1_06590 [Planctomycetaceae bacterium]|nr:MAG: hypothetical protein Ct9H300mP1_06590 [Planctomycetaceae bacterium]
MTPVSSVTQQAGVVAQLPYAPMPNYAVQPVPAYPFQPYQVPGGGMVFPGYYTSPGAAFFWSAGDHCGCDRGERGDCRDDGR